MLNKIIYALCILCGINSRAHSEIFVATLSGIGGFEFSANVSILYSDKAPRFENILRKFPPRNRSICTLGDLKANCVITKTRISGDFNFENTGRYGTKLYFVKPIPAILFHVMGHMGKGTEEEPWGAPQLGEAGTPPAKIKKYPTVHNPATKSQIRNFPEGYDKYLAGIYFWTYEPMAQVSDLRNALSILETLSKRPNVSDCAIFHCGAIFKFISIGVSGFAYCRFNKVSDVVSAPDKCIALSFTSVKGSFIASYTSPYIGDGWGAGLDGLECTIPIEDGIGTIDSDVEKIQDIIQSYPLNIKTRNRKIGVNEVMLFGAREFELSKIISNTYEYSTATLVIIKRPEEKKLVIVGNIGVSFNAQKVNDRKSMLEPDDYQLKQYKKEAIQQLEDGIYREFRKNARCYYQ